jgi:hypothetical protein
MASGGLRPKLQRQLQQIALELRQTGRLTIRPRTQLKPGTRLLREWQGLSHEVLVLNDGFSWQATHYRPLSAIARKITGTAWSGPLFFGLRSNRPATRPLSQASVPIDQLPEGRDAAGIAISAAPSIPANPPKKGSSRKCRVHSNQKMTICSALVKINELGNLACYCYIDIRRNNKIVEGVERAAAYQQSRDDSYSRAGNPYDPAGSWRSPDP